jgi:hypothetical protein
MRTATTFPPRIKRRREWTLTAIKMERPSGVEGADWSYRMIIEDRKPLLHAEEPAPLGSTDRRSPLLCLQATSGWR